MIKWTRTSRLSIKISLSRSCQVLFHHYYLLLFHHCYQHVHEYLHEYSCILFDACAVVVGTKSRSCQVSSYSFNVFIRISINASLHTDTMYLARMTPPGQVRNSVPTSNAILIEQLLFQKKSKNKFDQHVHQLRLQYSHNLLNTYECWKWRWREYSRALSPSGTA